MGPCHKTVADHGDVQFFMIKKIVTANISSKRCLYLQLLLFSYHEKTEHSHDRYRYGKAHSNAWRQVSHFFTSLTLRKSCAVVLREVKKAAELMDGRNTQTPKIVARN